MAIGTVKFFNAAKGFGFIVPEDGGNDIFVHTSAIESAGVALLTKDQRLSFETEQDAKGAVKACELKLLSKVSSPISAGEDRPASAKEGAPQRSTSRSPRQNTPRDPVTTCRQADTTGPHRSLRSSDNTNEWQRSYTRYCDLAQNTNGDAVARENCWQHAEHFLRMINGSST
jgi:cold shock protein